MQRAGWLAAQHEPVCGIGLRHGLIGQHLGERVDAWVELRDARERARRDLAAGQVAAAHGGGDLDGAELPQRL